jgi:hypothetical protein
VLSLDVEIEDVEIEGDRVVEFRSDRNDQARRRRP